MGSGFGKFKTAYGGGEHGSYMNQLNQGMGVGFGEHQSQGRQGTRAPNQALDRENQPARSQSQNPPTNQNP